MRTWLSLAAVVPLSLWSVTPVLAQDDPGPVEQLPPAITLTYADGRVEIARHGAVAAAEVPDLLDEGDRLLTSDGRAELALADGGVAHLDRGGDVRVERDGLRLVRGRLVVRTAAAPLDLITPVGVARLESDGLYDLTARDLDGDTSIAALAGRATLAASATDVPIATDDEVAIDPRGGEARWARLGARRDAFTDWAARRVDDMQLARRGQPLPVELAAFAPAFATYGRWDTLPTYGPAWFPTAGPGWRPYASGSWRYTRYGWTWIDADPWGWPVHHYGRWGRHPSRGWYWLPQRTWGPGWVGWAVESNYVGWAPLGWNSRPVVDFVVGARLGPLDLWAGSWSVVSRGVFGGRGPFGRHYADVRYLPGAVLGGFVAQGQPPRGPAGWPRRMTPAYGYGRPAPTGRVPGGVDRGRGPRGPAGSAVPRELPRPRVGDDSRPADRPAFSGGARDRRDGADRPADGPPNRDIAPRPADPRRERDADGGRSRAVMPRDRPSDGAYGRPAPAAGRAWGRPDADSQRAAPAASGRTAEPRGGAAAPSGADRGGGGQPRGGGARRGRGDGGGSNRRRSR